jgi:hypothetical protein
MARLTLFLLCVILTSVVLMPAGSRCEYTSREGFVSLLFSDTHYPDYTHIFPILEAYGMKASFCYITESSELGIEHEAWMMQEIYQAGHEVQDHTTRHDHMWATCVDTVEDGVEEWIPYTFANLATWDSLCERSLFILDSLGIEVVGWGQPGGGKNTTVPDHPGWSWRGMVMSPDDSLGDLISTKYSYVLRGGGPSPFTAHLNLRGHNCPQRFPIFCVPFRVIDSIDAEEAKTNMADAVASGLWFLAQSHIWKVERVAKVESLVAWLDSTNIEVITCVDGWQRIAYGRPDPLANQLPQARMQKDRDGNNKPDGFAGCCVWDTSTVSPVESTFCMTVYSGTTNFLCYGPEVGRNALSLWMRSPGLCGGGVRIIWVTCGFEGGILETGFNTFYPDTAWTLVDSTICPEMAIDVEDEVDRILVRILPLTGCESVTVAYPQLLLNAEAGAEMPEEKAGGVHDLVVSPNPIAAGVPLRVGTGASVTVYDLLGRFVLRAAPAWRQDRVTIDTRRLAPGVYLVTDSTDPLRNAKIIVYR